jgi:uncharacterized membrane protein
MKRLVAGFLAVGFLGLAGCDTHSTPGGPGASNSTGSNTKPTFGQADDTFTLSTPSLSTSIKQGEAKNVNIDIKRGKNFNEDVTLKLDGLPKGVTADPASPMIKHGDKEVTINLKAADDAGLGDHTVKVTGTPTKGAPATSEFKITVNKK